MTQNTDDYGTEVLHCPSCGQDGAFDGLGSEREITRRVRLDENDVKRGYKVTREWDEFHCPECGCTFRTLRDETEEQQPGRVIA